MICLLKIVIVHRNVSLPEDILPYLTTKKWGLEHGHVNILNQSQYVDMSGDDGVLSLAMLVYCRLGRTE